MPDPKRQRTGRNNKQRGTHWELVIMREFYNTERNKAGTNKADGCNHPWCIESKSHKGHPPAWLTDVLATAVRSACGRPAKETSFRPGMASWSTSRGCDRVRATLWRS